MAEIRHSVCALDCPDTCALLLNVEDGRGARLRGDPRHPVTQGFLCGKVAQYLEREYPETVQPVLADTSVQRLAELTNGAWAAVRR